MHIVFRVDASADIGSGHVMRCLALAAELSARRATCYFVCREMPGHLGSRISEHGYKLILLPLAFAYTSPRDNADYAGWLQVDEAADAADFVQCLDMTPDWIIVDHYGLGSIWERRIRDANPGLLGLAAIDDLGRKHAADLIVDQTLGRSATDYSAGNVGGLVLAGSEYALLRAEFGRLHEFVCRSREPSEHRVLVTMGGVDQHNVTLDVVNVIASSVFPWIAHTDVLLPRSAPYFDAVKRRIDELGAGIRLHEFVTDIADMMLAATISIGAPGTTTWERAAVGLPGVLVPIADNQRRIAQAMSEAKASVIVGREKVSADLPDALERVRAGWCDFVAINLTICDGLGSRRVAQRLMPLRAKDGAEVWLEKAGTKDIEQVYNWQIEPGTRRHARNPEPPAWEDHVQWMRQRLNSPDCFFYLLKHGGSAAGVIRLDRKSPGLHEVSIFIGADRKGNGLGSAALQLVADLHQECGIRAIVLEGNAASLRLFAANGYQQISDTEFVLQRRIA